MCLYSTSSKSKLSIDGLPNPPATNGSFPELNEWKKQDISKECKRQLISVYDLSYKKVVR